eukprot:SAG11_NODE_803_length_7098_cov_10.219174_8_plen_83_part_00
MRVFGTNEINGGDDVILHGRESFGAYEHEHDGEHCGTKLSGRRLATSLCVRQGCNTSSRAIFGVLSIMNVILFRCSQNIRDI